MILSVDEDQLFELDFDDQPVAVRQDHVRVFEYGFGIAVRLRFLESVSMFGSDKLQPFQVSQFLPQRDKHPGVPIDDHLMQFISGTLNELWAEYFRDLLFRKTHPPNAAFVFLEKDEGSIRRMCLSKQQIAEVLSPKLIERAGDKLHQVIVNGNTRVFVTLRQKLGNLEGLKFVRAEHGYRLQKSQSYRDPKPVLKNSYVVLADGNRLIVKIKLEELVFIDGKYHLVKLD